VFDAAEIALNGSAVHIGDAAGHADAVAHDALEGAAIYDKRAKLVVLL